ncbi:hypothetical protein ACFL54_00925 [Planctomycetota bacterium]
MICTECGFDNPAKQLFCTGCGAHLEMDFADIHDTFSEEIRVEREQKTAESIRQFFIFSVFLLLLCFVFRGCVVTNPPQPKVLPKLESPLQNVPAKESETIDPTLPLRLPAK